MASRVVNSVLERAQGPLSTGNYRGALAWAFGETLLAFRQRRKAEPEPAAGKAFGVSQPDAVAEPAKAPPKSARYTSTSSTGAPLEVESLGELSRLVREAMRTSPR